MSTISVSEYVSAGFAGNAVRIRIKLESLKVEQRGRQREDVVPVLGLRIEIESIRAISGR